MAVPAVRRQRKDAPQKNADMTIFAGDRAQILRLAPGTENAITALLCTQGSQGLVKYPVIGVIKTIQVRYLSNCAVG